MVHVLGFTMYSSTMARLEQWLIDAPVWAAFLATASAGWIALARVRYAGSPIEFEDLGEPDVRTLEIGV